MMYSNNYDMIFDTEGEKKVLYVTETEYSNPQYTNCDGLDNHSKIAKDDD